MSAAAALRRNGRDSRARARTRFDLSTFRRPAPPPHDRSARVTDGIRFAGRRYRRDPEDGPGWDTRRALDRALRDLDARWTRLFDDVRQLEARAQAVARELRAMLPTVESLKTCVAMREMDFDDLRGARAWTR